MSKELRPEHYKKGEDTFAWAERKLTLEACLAICAFNIHKYNDRDKGQDYDDFGKIADYAMWARDMMERGAKEPSLELAVTEDLKDIHYSLAYINESGHIFLTGDNPRFSSKSFKTYDDFKYWLENTQ